MTNFSILKTNELDSILTDLTIGNSTIGGSNNVVSVSNIKNIKYVKNQINYITTQSWSPTVNEFLLNGTIICFTFSSANPSTINDIITINLPTPTAELNGVYFYFRKIRGAINNTATNYTLNTSPASIININATATTTGQPISAFSTNALLIRILVLEVLGTYYWTIT